MSIKILGLPPNRVNRVLPVPGEFPTVQAAIDWLAQRPSNGCTVAIAEGTVDNTIININRSHRNIANLTIDTPENRPISFGGGFLVDGFSGGLTVRHIQPAFSAARWVEVRDSVGIVLDEFGTVPANGTEDAIIHATSSSLTVQNSTLESRTASHPNQGITLISSMLRMSNSLVTGYSFGVYMEDGCIAEIEGGTVRAARPQGVGYAGVGLVNCSDLLAKAVTVEGPDYGIIAKTNSLITVDGSLITGDRLDGVMAQQGSVFSAINNVTTVRDCGAYGVRIIYGSTGVGSSNLAFSNNALGDFSPATANAVDTTGSYRG